MERTFGEILDELGFRQAGAPDKKDRYPVAAGTYWLQTYGEDHKKTVAHDDEGSIWEKSELVNLSAFGFTSTTAPLAVELRLVLEPLGFAAMSQTSQYTRQYFIQRAEGSICTIAYDEKGSIYGAVGEIPLPSDLFTLVN